MKTRILPVVALAVGLLGASVRAEEASSGHYVVGAQSSFIDVPPTEEAFAVLNMYNFYTAEAGVTGKLLHLGGTVAMNIKATAHSDTTAIIYAPPLKLAGAQYAFGAAVPQVWLTVEGDVKAGPLYAHKKSTNVGLGDILVLPLMLEWKTGDLSYGFTLGVYAPTGDYEKGNLSNLGKNYWTFEPGVNASWISHTTGIEVTGFAGIDISTKNTATNYQSGEVLHLEGTVAQHLPLFGGIAGVGVTGFYYQQLTGDDSNNPIVEDLLGGFKGTTMGVGPVISYMTKVGKKANLVMELKWLPELKTENRLEGDSLWLKMVLVF